MAALHHLLEMEFHIVAQIVEAELVVGGIGHVIGILLAALGIGKTMDDAADAEAQEIIDLAHPPRVAAGEIVIDRHHMHAFGGQRIEIDRQGRHQRLAFAGLHLRDAALMEDHAADQLDIEMALSEGTFGGLADGGKGGRQEVLERAAIGQLFAEFHGSSLEGVIRQADEAVFQGVYLGYPGCILSDLAVICGAEYPRRHRTQSKHIVSSFGNRAPPATQSGPPFNEIDAAGQLPEAGK